MIADFQSPHNFEIQTRIILSIFFSFGLLFLLLSMRTCCFNNRFSVIRLCLDLTNSLKNSKMSKTILFKRFSPNSYLNDASSSYIATSVPSFKMSMYFKYLYRRFLLPPVISLIIPSCSKCLTAVVADVVHRPVISQIFGMETIGL